MACDPFLKAPQLSSDGRDLHETFIEIPAKGARADPRVVAMGGNAASGLIGPRPAPSLNRLRIMEADVRISIVRFPAVPDDRDKDFRQWFAWSNDQLRETAGLTSRRLLRASDGCYTVLVEHESARL